MLAAAVLATGCAPAATPPAAQGRRAVEEPRAFEVVTLNLWHDQDEWPARLEAIVDGLGAVEPDALCLQEVLERPGLPNQAVTLASRLGYTATFASWDSVGAERRYGNAILSRDSIVTSGQRLLEPADDYRVIVHVRVAQERDTLDLYCTHLHHTAEGAEMRRTQLLDALDFIDLSRGDGAVVFAGDFNAPADAPELATLRDRFGDAYGTVHGDTANEVSTLNTAKGHRSARIDHVFFRSGPLTEIEPESAALILDQPTADGVWPSDHFGILVRFLLR